MPVRWFDKRNMFNLGARGRLAIVGHLLAGGMWVRFFVSTAWWLVLAYLFDLKSEASVAPTIESTQRLIIERATGKASGAIEIRD